MIGDNVTGKEFRHVSIMLDECISYLKVKPDGIYADATLGGAGHASAVCAKLSENGIFIGIDRDLDALSVSRERLSKYSCRLILEHSNYTDIKDVLEKHQIESVDGILADLGVSSYQFDNGERGFSYRFDAPLDMRMDQTQTLTCYDIVNGYEFEKLFRIIKEYGEEKFAHTIAKNIVKQRENKPISTTFELVKVIEGSMPKKYVATGKNKAAKTFQALRIEVNNELNGLRQAVENFFDCLSTGGRLAVITFHSLEDRIVKTAFKEFATGCTCPKEFPVCICGKEPRGRLITKKPVIPCEEEMLENTRSTSAKLRVIEKIEPIEKIGKN